MSVDLAAFYVSWWIGEADVDPANIRAVRESSLDFAMDENWSF